MANPIQIITRIATNIVSTQNYLENSNAGGARAAQNAGGSGMVQNFQGNMQAESANHAQIIFTRPAIILPEASALKLTTIEIDKKANYVKDLMNLPKEFSELVELITSSNPEIQNLNEKMAQELNKLLNGGKIDLNALAKLLNTSSKEASQKLMMTMANLAKYGANDLSGLKELMNFFAANTAVMQDSQALKNLLLLYLPWLPLSVRHQDNLDFTVDIFDKIKGPDPDKENPTETVTVLIETKNYSNVAATLELNPRQQVDVVISAKEDFPQKKVLELLEKENLKNNVETNVSAQISKDLKQDPIKEMQANVKILSQSSISPKLMLTTQSLIKIIIQLDYEKSIIKEEEEDGKGC